MPTGQDWYDSAQWKVVRMLNNEASATNIGRIRDLLEILEKFFPEIVAMPESNGVYDCLGKISHFYGRLQSDLLMILNRVTPSHKDKSIRFADSEIDPFEKEGE